MLESIATDLISEKEAFIRLEDKFLLLREAAEELLPLVESKLDLVYLVPGMEFMFIESVYFESAGFILLRNLSSGFGLFPSD